jgi:CheY-like chemotaxis protein/anti-sigma regulatory factor (Ser/Thr protein kinase)
MISFDPHYLQPVISNLLSNALKFTTKGGIITLQLLQESEGRVSLSVEDTGIGIAPEHLTKIFDRYYQVEGAFAEASGTGIGLTYVYELVKAMGGEITVNSVVGIGSVFTIHLPALNGGLDIPRWEPAQSLSKDEKILPKIGIEKSSAKPVVLVVEDNYEMAQFIIRALTGEFEVQHALNGVEGLDKALTLVPDLVVTDVMMPEINGFEFCEALKKHPVTNHIPVVLLTARADDADRIRGLSQGADIYLTKPFSKEVLRLHLRNLIALRNRLRARLQPQLQESTGERVGDTPEEVFASSVYKILSGHYSEPEFGVEDMARQFGMSVSQFHRKSGALLGNTPGEIIRKYRLEQSRSLLLQSNGHSISEIAYSVGFRDPNYFSQAFSRAYGKSPSQFRQFHENGHK